MEGFLDIFSVAELPSTHPGAIVEQGGKAIHTTAEQGFLCFGQYKQGYPVMPLQAVFSILIDNNTEDDRNILILDVYDHHSDRVIGKRVITRRDFAKANEFCLFTFDFMPPSQQANMEFRIYYMGHAYVVANKIAVIDPAKVMAVDSSREVITSIPDISASETVEEHELSEPWKIAKIGNGSGKVSRYNLTKAEVNAHKGTCEYGGEFTVEASGSIQDAQDDFYFLYLKWSPESGNGKIVAKFSQKDGFVGVMFRETLDPDSRFIMLEKNRILYRERRGGGISEERVPGSGEPRGLKLVRKRYGSEQYFVGLCSEDISGEFGPTRQLNFSMPQQVYVGLAVATATATVGLGIDYKDEV